MRILYVHRTQAQGAEGAHIHGMVEALVTQGHRVSMLCPPGCNPMDHERGRAGMASPGEPGAASPEPTGRGSPWKQTYGYLSERAPQWVFELLELGYNAVLLAGLAWKCLRFRPQLVYERYALNTFACALGCRLLGIPRVLEVNDSVVIERSRPLTMKRVATFLERVSLRSAVLTITITDRFRQLLEERHRLRQGSILVFPNAVSSVRFRGPFDRDQLRKTWGLEGTVLGASGQFLSWHGIDVLVQALGPEAPARGLRFFFIGDGPARTDVEAAAERLGIPDRVRFTGMVPVTEVPHLLACLDMAVLPSVASHASPMKLMEYMAVGLPLVAADMPSVRALVGEREAILVKPGDPEALKRGVETLLDDPTRARSLGQAARAAVFARHTWDGHVTTLMVALQRLGVRAGTV